MREGAIVDASVVESAQRPRKPIDVVPHDRKEDEKINDPSQTNTQEYQSQTEKCETTYSKDKDAHNILKSLCKGKRFYYGYKVHASVDSKLVMVLSKHYTGANKSDTGEFQKLIANSRIMTGGTVFANKGYAT